MAVIVATIALGMGLEVGVVVPRYIIIGARLSRDFVFVHPFDFRRARADLCLLHLPAYVAVSPNEGWPIRANRRRQSGRGARRKKAACAREGQRQAGHHGHRRSTASATTCWD